MYFLLLCFLSTAAALCPAGQLDINHPNSPEVCKTEAQAFQLLTCCSDSAAAGCANYLSCTAGGGAATTSLLTQTCTFAGVSAASIDNPAAKENIRNAIASALNVAAHRVTITGVVSARRRLSGTSTVTYTLKNPTAAEITNINNNDPVGTAGSATNDLVKNTVATTAGVDPATVTATTGAASSASTCDASAAPANGNAGTCAGVTALSGDNVAECQPECDAGYTASGTTKCNDGVLAAATCVSDGPPACVPNNGCCNDPNPSICMNPNPTPVANTPCDPACGKDCFESNTDWVPDLTSGGSTWDIATHGLLCSDGAPGAQTPGNVLNSESGGLAVYHNINPCQTPGGIYGVNNDLSQRTVCSWAAQSGSCASSSTWGGELHELVKKYCLMSCAARPGITCVNNALVFS